MKSKLIRIFDINISLVLLLILSGLILIIYSSIFLFNGRPVIYQQSRVGYQGKQFKILKFRTMKNKILKNENERLTKIGKFIRRLSLDEIPQFINVLKGEMSIVGPRPLPKIIEKKITIELRVKEKCVARYYRNVSNKLYWKKRKIDEKVKLDILYVKNYSLYFYLKILIKTPYIYL